MSLAGGKKKEKEKKKRMKMECVFKEDNNGGQYNDEIMNNVEKKTVIDGSLFS